MESIKEAVQEFYKIEGKERQENILDGEKFVVNL
jgi:hypothetical protein